MSFPPFSQKADTKTKKGRTGCESMKVYSNNFLGIDVGPASGMVKPLLVVLALLLVIGVLFTQNANVLHAQLGQNPLYLSQNDSTILSVLVSNPENTPVNNIVVSLNAPGSTQLSLYPAQQVIQTLGPQEIRKLEFLVSPIDAQQTPFLPGMYRVDVTTQINGKNYQTSVFVNVEK